jgi:gluconate transporter
LAHGPYLVLITLLAIGFLLFLILIIRLHAFLALFLASMGLGLAAGLPPTKVLSSMQAGVGDALSFIAVVVGFGAMIGSFLEHSGGGQALADWLLRKFGDSRAQWAVLLTGFIVGLPVFFEVGFIIVAPLAWNLSSKSKRSLLFYGLPIAAALTITHSLVPPHPAPALAAQLLGADVGRAILYGVALSIPLMIAGGIMYGAWIGNKISPRMPEIAERLLRNGDKSGVAPPSVSMVAFLLVLPILLIFTATTADLYHLPGQNVWKFVGHPFTALLTTVLAVSYFFGFKRGLNREQVTKLATSSLAPIGNLLLIIGGGGALKQVIVDSGVGQYGGKLLASSPISPLLVVFIISLALRAAQGSATVAIVTAAGIVAPMMKQFVGYKPEMILLALCCGGTAISHVNDAGFWLVKEYLGATVPETLRSWTVMKMIMGSLGIVLVLILQRL